ncbi:hypothetical protein K437DRAFT_160914 [Tilletiaria anomala UBC 951]|uniref:Uncharacterized protein n=1 Tax=Tilletiaria anomala (strain ATCC 24038 / CBS 436.72 / UBC 951) TaxID=1037660 RepID=A0A066VUN1_TILAU|nr:uncharacterized protein K437DRAFT_160914 [Tilletiaria anomala UBC 951]KDN42519.1 hypothetical protein K437DRAFT_160914 [Tilletiaria anomala UBC 951]
MVEGRLYPYECDMEVLPCEGCGIEKIRLGLFTSWLPSLKVNSCKEGCCRSHCKSEIMKMRCTMHLPLFFLLLIFPARECSAHSPFACSHFGVVGAA